MNRISEQTKTVDSVERSLEILEELREQGRGSITGLSESLGFSPSSVHNHLMTLQQAGYVVREGDLYKLSLRFLSHGEFVRKQIPMYRRIREHVDLLAEETNENVSFIVEQQGRGVFIYRKSGGRKLLTAEPGDSAPIHCLSGGKAILAALPPSQVERILENNELNPMTDNTISDRDGLFDELETIKERGYAINRGERIERLQSIAVAISGNSPEPIGAIAVVGPKHRMQGQQVLSTISDQLLATVEEIELNTVE